LNIWEVVKKGAWYSIFLSFPQLFHWATMDFVGKLYLSYFKILTVVPAKNFDHLKKFVTVVPWHQKTVDEILSNPREYCYRYTYRFPKKIITDNGRECKTESWRRVITWCISDTNNPRANWEKWPILETRHEITDS